jgi:serine/threonine protein kinase/Leucine-rich repeat (LRR) protein
VAWLRAEHPDIDAALAALAGAERGAALVELAHAELELRLKAGEPARVEDYLCRYPELSGQPNVVVDLIATELRQRGRDKPDLAVEEYRARFPHLEAELDIVFGNLARASTGSGLAGITPGPGAAATPARGTVLDLCQTILAPAESPGDLGRLGPYRVLKVLGRGGMGVVFLAHDPALDRPVALKTVLPNQAEGEEVRRRFLREARAAAAVRHDNIVVIHQVGEDRGMPFLAMEYLEGETLEDRLRHDKRLPLAEALRVGEELARALAHAHGKGLIHRDVKPGNIWLEGEPAAGAALGGPVPGGSPGGATWRRVKLLDFGLSRAGEGEPHLTQPGGIVGTPAYMAPEQARGEEVDCRCDLFSLGAVLYRLTTGEQPFKGHHTFGVLTALATHRPPPPHTVQPDLPVALSDLVMRLLAKDSANRPSSARAVAEELAALAADLGKGERPARAEKKAPGPVRAVAASAAKEPESTILTEPGPAPGPRAKTGRGRKSLLIGLGLLALVPLGWWLATVVLRVETPNGTLLVKIDDPETEAWIKNGKLILTGPDGKVRYTLAPSERDKKIEAGPYTVRVEGADGLTLDTPEFTMKKGGEVTVRVTAEPRAVAKASDPDRTAALWALKHKGVVGVEVAGEPARQVDQPGALPSSPFRLVLAHLEGRREIGDQELNVLEGLQGLVVLNLGYTNVSDVGLAHLEHLETLQDLVLWHTRVMGAGLASLRRMKKLQGLALDAIPVSDEHLESLQGLTELQSLTLSGSQVAGPGLRHLRGAKGLRGLTLNKTRLSDTGLEQLAEFKNLNHLEIAATLVTNDGLRRLGDLTKLELLGLGATAIGDEGLKHLKELKNLRHLGLDQTQVTNDGLRQIGGLTKLQTLRLEGTAVGDEGLKHLKELKNLTLLGLARTQVTGDGLRQIGGLTKLQTLGLDGTRVADAGLDNLQGLTRLRGIWLGYNGERITDAGLKAIARLPQLEELFLNNTSVSDAGIATLKTMVQLKVLNVKSTEMTADGVKQLRAALPACRVEWDAPNGPAAPP